MEVPRPRMKGQGVQRILLLLLIQGAVIFGQDPPKVVSQCFRPQGFSFVSLYCGYGRLIQIHAAYHGRHLNPRIEHCGELREDCTKEMTNSYDWSKCEGKQSCVQMIRKSDMSDVCPDTAMQAGVEYLQIEYKCSALPGQEDEMPVTGDPRRGSTRRTSTKRTEVDFTEKPKVAEVHNLCLNYSQQVREEVHIASPGYPDFYMAGTDCRCAVKASKDAKVAVTYAELSLVQRARQCVDWLLLQSPGRKDSTAVTCGRLDQPRTVLSATNWLLMHLHTAPAEPGAGMKKAMPGFKVVIKAVPSGPFNIKCYSVHPDVLNGLKRKAGKNGGSGLLLPASDWDDISHTGALNRGSSLLRPASGPFLGIVVAIASIFTCGKLVTPVWER